MAVNERSWKAYGSGINLARFMFRAGEGVAETAASNWINSAGHHQTMLRDAASCLGTGVYRNGGMVYCYMVVGDPSGISPV